MEQRLFEFETSVPAKWIIAGEHAVLRGQPAIAMPHPEFFFRVCYRPSQSNRLEIKTGRGRSTAFHLLKRLSAKTGKPIPSGELVLKNTIPIGAGFGSSAALCVALSRFWFRDGGLEDSELIRLATELENEFHAESSGVDVTTVVLEAPIFFFRGKHPEPLQVKNKEILKCFRFYDTELRARTRDAVEQVSQLFREDLQRAETLDQKMGAAVEEIGEGLWNDQRHRIVSGMNDAHRCFESWGLVPASTRRMIEELKHQGAEAVKLTGAGKGGFLVALWPEGSSLLSTSKST